MSDANSLSGALWQTSLRRIQQRFEDAADRSPSLACVLVQSMVPNCEPMPDWPSFGVIKNWHQVGSGLGVESKPAQLFSPDGGPLAAEKPTLDPHGEPLLFSDGSPVAIRPGIATQYRLYSDQDTGHQFHYNAIDGAKCLDGLPSRIRTILWCDWPPGFSKHDELGYWISAVFEIAWQKHVGSPLQADRWVWAGNLRWRLNDLEQWRQIAHADLERIPDPPLCWFSEIEDLYRASVAAIDVLLALPTISAGEPSDQRVRVVDHAAQIVAVARNFIHALAQLPIDSDKTTDKRQADYPLKNHFGYAMRAAATLAHVLWPIVVQPASQVAGDSQWVFRIEELLTRILRDTFRVTFYYSTSAEGNIVTLQPRDKLAYQVWLTGGALGTVPPSSAELPSLRARDLEILEAAISQLEQQRRLGELHTLSDLISTGELAALAGVGRPRFLNVMSEERAAGMSDVPRAVVKGSGSRSDSFSYAACRPFLLRKWPARGEAGFFPETLDEVKRLQAGQ